MTTESSAPGFSVPQTESRASDPGSCRVFSASEHEPAHVAILEHVRRIDADVRGDFGGDEAGWFRADFKFGQGQGLHVERYFSTEQGIRAELNSWSAWIETFKDRPDWAQQFIDDAVLA